MIHCNAVVAGQRRSVETPNNAMLKI